MIIHACLYFISVSEVCLSTEFLKLLQPSHMSADLINDEFRNFIFILQCNPICDTISNDFILLSDLAILQVHMFNRGCFSFILIFHKNIRIELKVKQLELLKKLAVWEKLPFKYGLRVGCDLLFELRFLLWLKHRRLLQVSFQMFLVIENKIHQLVNTLVHYICE